VKRLLPGAEVVCKIESQRGLAYAERCRNRHGRLMAARGDLYVEVVRPHRVLGALRKIIAADPQAMVASRLFGSLARNEVPDAADLGDAAHLLMMGYRTFMLGDEVCLRPRSVLAALNLLQAVAGEMQAA
jgi:pyruvate kinase